MTSATATLNACANTVTLRHDTNAGPHCQSSNPPGTRSLRHLIAASVALSLSTLASPVLATPSDPVPIEVDTAIFEGAAERTQRLESVPARSGRPGRLDRDGEMADASMFKNTITADQLTQDKERAFLRGVFSGAEAVLLTADGQTIKMPNLIQKSALQILAPLIVTAESCASVYWLLGALQPGSREEALARARVAANHHIQSNPSITLATLEQRIMATSRERAQRIQKQQEPTEWLGAELRACDVLFEF
ncbi:hypothetical protein [Orrella marina]|uniref:Uncharacterized protein n=1 Tax=Orrella marina TaxID=2163011 RepID=A0A2R4XHG3_9BURK|nr:hypothetical protein [Orrella marina]AWB33183.1 hypothetical protein DBV39_05065 [Orrella marina]